MDRDLWLAEKRREIENLGDVATHDLVPSRRDFLQFAATQKRGVAVVARLKRADPLTGGRWPGADLVALARIADEADVGAVAVCTGGAFAARNGDLEACSAAVSAPVLRDDLCLDAKQIYAARLAGADAVLVPAGALTPAAVVELVEVGASLHMAAVVEARDAAELAVALACPHAAIGLNCAADDGFLALEATRNLAAATPPRRLALVLAEPREPDEIASLAGAIDAALIGDLILAAADPGAVLTALVERLA